MDIRFDGKRALVTGAGKGIGKALTLKLVEAGAEVVAVSRTQSDLDELEKTSSKIQTVFLDIGNWDATKDALQGIGTIDLLVNNAAVLDNRKYGQYTEEVIDRLFDINVKPVINISQMIVEGMKARGEGGAIVNVSSMMAIAAGSEYGAYCASKGAMDQLTRTMAIEFGPYNIRVNSVNPTVVRTGMAEIRGWFDPQSEFANRAISRTPLRRFAEVEDIVNPIMFLLSDKAAMITGITLPIDGGLNVVFM